MLALLFKHKLSQAGLQTGSSAQFPDPLASPAGLLGDEYELVHEEVIPKKAGNESNQQGFWQFVCTSNVCCFVSSFLLWAGDQVQEEAFTSR